MKVLLILKSISWPFTQVLEHLDDEAGKKDIWKPVRFTTKNEAAYAAPFQENKIII